MLLPPEVRNTPQKPIHLAWQSRKQPAEVQRSSRFAFIQSRGSVRSCETVCSADRTSAAVSRRVPCTLHTVRRSRQESFATEHKAPVPKSGREFRNLASHSDSLGNLDNAADECQHLQKGTFSLAVFVAYMGSSKTCQPARPTPSARSEPRIIERESR